MHGGSYQKLVSLFDIVGRLAQRPIVPGEVLAGTDISGDQELRAGGGGILTLLCHLPNERTVS